MGEVYRARDPRLQRDVAIRIVPALFATDPERRARFEREAQVLAALNHPSVAQIFGVEESAGVPALVMEVVEGSTLDELIRPPVLPRPLARRLPADGTEPSPNAVVESSGGAKRQARDRRLFQRDRRAENRQHNEETSLMRTRP